MVLPTYEDIVSPELLEATREYRHHFHKQVVGAVTRIEAKWVDGENETIVAFLSDESGTVTKYDHLIINQG